MLHILLRLQRCFLQKESLSSPEDLLTKATIFRNSENIVFSYFKRICIGVKRPYYLPHALLSVCLSARLHACLPVFVRLSIRVYRRNSHSTDFREIGNWELLPKYFQNIQTWLISDASLEDRSKAYCFGRLQIAIKVTSSAEVVLGCQSIRLSVCPTEPTYVKLDIGSFYENLSRNFKFG
jgi:hypothetical protein